MKQKYEVFTKFKQWKAEVEKQTEKQVKYLRTNNGMKYLRIDNGMKYKG